MATGHKAEEDATPEVEETPTVETPKAKGYNQETGEFIV